LRGEAVPLLAELGLPVLGHLPSVGRRARRTAGPWEGRRRPVSHQGPLTFEPHPEHTVVGGFAPELDCMWRA
jgi:hypothetical protein